MRFYPFGSGSITFYVDSASSAVYSNTAEHGLRTISASIAISGSIGLPGDNGVASTFHGPYETYPPGP
jgi:hypothetical protein